MLAAVEGKRVDDPYAAAEQLCEASAAEIPQPLKGLDKRAVRFTTVIDRDKIEDFVYEQVADK